MARLETRLQSLLDKTVRCLGYNGNCSVLLTKYCCKVASVILLVAFALIVLVVKSVLGWCLNSAHCVRMSHEISRP